MIYPPLKLPDQPVIIKLAKLVQTAAGKESDRSDRCLQMQAAIQGA